MRQCLRSTTSGLMYLYLYDSFLNNKKYNTLLARIETRLTDLGIGGKIFRLSPLRNLAELLSDEIRTGSQTVVVVGNDKTVSQVINVAGKYDIVLGIIPIGPDNKIARTLGIFSPLEACNVVAARIIEKIDLGKVNDSYFLTNLTLSGGRAAIECEDNYQVTAPLSDQITICNLIPLQAAGVSRGKYFNPQDGRLEILIQPEAKSSWGLFKKNQSENSIIPFKKIIIRGKNSVSVITDGQKVLKPPVKVEVVPKKLKIIVGRKRMF